MKPDHFRHQYLGGANIDRLRGATIPGPDHPEEWLASTTARFGEETLGLSRLPDGTYLRDAVEADPVAWLGAEHVERYGVSTGLLVKLLDAGQRLPVHAHPSRDFARQHLNCPYGKTEAWVVIGTGGDDTCVWLGFTEDVDATRMRTLVDTQDAEAFLAMMHRIVVHPGDTVLVEAGLPHAIGEGAFVVELQEPTDFSILLEWEGFAFDGPRDGHLGLGFDLALQAVDRRAKSPEHISRLVRRDVLPTAAVDELVALMPEPAAPFFRADGLRPAASTTVPAGFGVLVVLEGSGTLDGASGTLDVRRGEVYAVPAAAGELVVSGDLTAVLCRPPAPDGRP